MTATPGTPARILPWQDVQPGDRALRDGALSIVRAIWTAEAEDWLEVRFTDGSTLHVPGHHLTAVVTEGD